MSADFVQVWSPPVSLELWCRLEDTLLRRFNRKRSNEVLASLRKWSAWRWPTEREVLDSLHITQQAAARRRREAAAEFPRMQTLPPITPPADVPLLLERRRFGIPAEIVWPDDRCLSPFHALAIVRLGVPMTQAVSRIIGGRLLVSFDELAHQAELRDEEQDVRILQLEDDRAAAGRMTSERGPQFAVLA
jgi:hypothetical protein